ncbi:MAG: hypothetical protein EGQ17_01905, partial [Lachnospiraceae bacterium]|nr:hypothetical protein [Lachnospiraceae bacterium]
EWASCLYGSDRTWYLVNGSTCGLLSAISAAVSHGGKILVSRNCHKAVYHGIYLNHLEAVYVYPQQVPGLGIQGGILPEDVENALQKSIIEKKQQADGKTEKDSGGDREKNQNRIQTDIQAVMIVSPTYDGVCSDVRRIAGICHRYGVPLIVDQAHGAHFPFSEYFPEDAVSAGADVVIHSVHKTLPAMTQTALLHVQGEIANRERIRKFLSIYQSSSPSYVLMASIDACVDLIERDGEELFAKHVRELKNFRESCRELKWLYLAGLDSEKDGTWQSEAKTAEFGQTADFDRSKLLISARRANLAGAGLTGEELSRILRERYHIQMEMSGPDYVVGIAGIADSEEGFGRLAEALYELDQDMDEKIPVGVSTADKVSAKSNALPRLKAVLTIGEAAEAESACRPLAVCEGAVAGNYVYLYPPGIPVLAPGERVTEELLKCIEEWLEAGYEVHGLKYDGDGIPKLGIVKE